MGHHQAYFFMHDFFAGSGLVSFALKDYFKCVWANDCDLKKAAIYKANIKDAPLVIEDLRNISGYDLPFAHLSWVSFPCQDLSQAGSQEGILGLRSGLVWEFFRVFDEFKAKPQIVVLENVKGLLSSQKGEHYKILHQALVKRGFKCGAILLNASYFVPQSRPRVFILAVSKDLKIPNNLISNGPCWLHDKTLLALGKELPNWLWWHTNKPLTSALRLEDLIEKNLPFDKDEVIKQIPLPHLKKLNEYESFITTGFRRTRNGHVQLELRFDGLAGCLRTPKGGSSRQYLIVKEGCDLHARLLSVREAARLMGAPDSFLIKGCASVGFKAMGDAVVVSVAKFIAQKFLLPLAKAFY